MRPIPLVSLLTLTSLALSFAPDAARAEDPPAAPPPAERPRASLGLRAAPGRPVRFVQRMTTRQRMETKAGSFESLFDLSTEMSVEVTGKAASGGWNAVVSFGCVRGVVAEPFLGRHDVDSRRPLPDDVTAKSLVLSVTAVAGASFDVVLAPDGRATAVGGIDAAIDRALARHGGDASLRPLLTQAMSAQEIQRRLDVAFVATPYPAEEVAAGSAWSDSDALPGFWTGVEMEVRYRQEVTEVTEGSVRIAGKGQLDVRPAAGPGGGTKMAKVVRSSQVVEAPAVSDCRIARDDGLPLLATADVRLTLDLREPADPKVSRGKLTQHLDFRLERVAEWPSASEPQAPPPDAGSAGSPTVPAAPSAESPSKDPVPPR